MKHTRKFLEKENKELKKSILVMFVAFLIVSLSLGYLFYATLGHSSSYGYNSYHPQIFSHTKIITEGLDAPQEERAKIIISEVDSLYLKFVKSITVVKDIESYCNQNPSYNCDACLELGCGGWNSKQKIVIRYDDVSFGTLLCHEILHSFIYSEGDIIGKNDWSHPLHQIVFDISRKGTCLGDFSWESEKDLT